MKAKNFFSMGYMIFVLIIFSISFVPISAKNIHAKDTHTIVFEGVWPQNHDRTGEKSPFGKWMDNVEYASEGRIKFERNWGGTPVPPKEALNALSKGSIDFLLSSLTYYSGHIGLGDISYMPFNFKTHADVYDLWWNGGIREIMNSAYEDRINATILFPVVAAGYNFQISKKAKKVRTVDDFKGMKIRDAGGITHSVLKALGASPVLTIAGEYYTALQKGTIDAGLMTTYSLETYKIWEVCDQVVDPPVLSQAWVGAIMNLDKWNSLGPELQDLMLTELRKLESLWIAYCNTEDKRVIKMAEEKGVEFYTLPPEEQEKERRLLSPVWDIYVENCEKQGLKDEAKKLRSICEKRFSAQ